MCTPPGTLTKATVALQVVNACILFELDFYSPAINQAQRRNGEAYVRYSLAGMLHIYIGAFSKRLANELQLIRLSNHRNGFSNSKR